MNNTPFIGHFAKDNLYTTTSFLGVVYFFV
jgi:hypothetical protein